MYIDQPLIEIDNVSFAYNGNTVLDRVSFTIDHGDYVGIVGPNGGGKTTLLKILVGLLEPASGTVHMEGVPIHSFKEKFKIGYVPQRIAQDNSSFPATVYEIVQSGRTPEATLFSRPNRAKDAQTVENALEIAQISDLKHKLMSNLSGGQRQRVYVARALAAEPKILMLDEPFVGIDIATQKDFYAFLQELNEKQGLTILFVSHDIDILTTEVKSILCLNRGLLCFGAPSMLEEPHVMEHLYGKKITHIHHSH